MNEWAISAQLIGLGHRISGAAGLRCCRCGRTFYDIRENDLTCEPRVINVKDYPDGLPPNTVRVGRPGPWGNPYPVRTNREGGTKGFSRRDAIDLFRKYAIERLRREPDWLVPLKGKILACHCAPLACHADVLIDLGA